MAQTWGVPHGFPHGLSNEQLAEAVAEIASYVPKGPGFRTWNAEAMLALLQAALQEQAQREVRKATRSARRASNIAVFIAVVGTTLALVFGISDYKGDESWHDDQSRLLQQLHDDLASIPLHDDLASIEAHLAELETRASDTSLSEAQIRILRQVRDAVRAQAGR